MKFPKLEQAGPSVVAVIVFAAASTTYFGCRGRSSAAHDRKSVGHAAATASAVPLDHLLPGELSASSAFVFGFPVPNGMTVERVFPDAAHLVGEVSLPGLVDYVQKHAVVAAPELAGSSLVFEPARILSQGESRSYRMEISSIGRRVRLLVRDTTPPPQQPGLSDEERWRRAGLKPNGEPLAPTEML